MSDQPIAEPYALDTGRAAHSAAYSPLYQQIKAMLLQSLDRGEWKPGEPIPSELELAARFQVSQGTVRKAIDELAADNLLLRRQGKGTFVATHYEAKVRFRFLRLAPDDGRQQATSSRVLECSRIKPPADVAKQLDLRTSDQVFNLRRVLSFNDVPTIFEDIWLPGALFKGLSTELLAEHKIPLYGLFESEFGVSMVRAEEKLRALAAPTEQAQHLSVQTGTPLLQVERVAYTYGDRPVEVRRGWYLTQHFHYRNSLN
ncbi:GntR family transcriptional regulator [Pusillimonas sp. CC-YST705]|uniref:GntR family transcriptional regulator n=1 Tax=Mesopusillimonas faecipullorum TaxID=2755040 RepID=A0ABS8C867_9BURK|nr:GntR family transcriptional regulator [Mesopusillimonas faecipullorum]MCB5362226.1 GntR family transcriptional regulator [Mesopusillimonas faecipullorum]